MKPKYKPSLVRILVALLVFFILFVSCKILSTEFNLRKYEKVFVQLEHPPYTSLIDPFHLKIIYYPATYVDESIPFKSARLVGELRRFTRDWHEVAIFYKNKTLEGISLNTLPVIVLPVEIDYDGQKNTLHFGADFSYSVFEYDLLARLEDYYDRKGTLQGLSSTEKNLYLVYVAVLP